jgi:hypothetical protein
MHAAVEGLVLHADEFAECINPRKTLQEIHNFFSSRKQSINPANEVTTKTPRNKKKFSIAHQNLSLVDIYLYKRKEPTVETQNQAASHQNPEKPPTAPTKLVLEYESPITTVVAAPRRTSSTGDCDKRSGEHHQTLASNEL